jgi:hypothetical protein
MKRSNSRRLFVTVVATALLAMGAGNNALAGYQVSISSELETGAGGSACSYNFASHNPNGGCILAPGVTGSVMPPSSPPDNSGAATKAMLGISGGGTLPASGSVAADLSTASVHLSASSTNGAPASEGSVAAENGNYSDTLHFTVGGAGPTTSTPVGFTFTIDGTMLGSGPFASGELMGQVDVGPREAQFDLVLNSSTNDQTAIGYLRPDPNGMGIWTHNAALTQFTYTDSFDITGPSESFGILLGSQLICEYGVSCDYGDTLQAALTYPSNVTLTSDSGVFPTETPSPTPAPEPGTLGLLAFGMAGVAVSRRWRLR